MGLDDILKVSLSAFGIFTLQKSEYTIAKEKPEITCVDEHSTKYSIFNLVGNTIFLINMYKSQERPRADYSDLAIQNGSSLQDAYNYSLTLPKQEQIELTSRLHKIQGVFREKISPKYSLHANKSLNE